MLSAGTRDRPELAVAHCNLADLLQGDPKEAEESLRRALKFNPKNVQAREFKLGVSLCRLGANTKEARL